MDKPSLLMLVVFLFLIALIIGAAIIEFTPPGGNLNPTPPPTEPHMHM